MYTQSAEGWGQWFAILKHASAEMVDDMSHLLEVAECRSPLATPWKGKGIHSDLIIHDPKCNYQGQIDNNMYAHLEDQISVMGAKFLSHLDAGLVGVTKDLAEVARETSDFAMMTDHNVQKMDTLLTSMEARVGKPVKINGESFPDAWATIKFLANELERGEDIINELRGAAKVL